MYYMMRERGGDWMGINLIGLKCYADSKLHEWHPTRLKHKLHELLAAIGYT